MGTSFSHDIAEAKEAGGRELILEQKGEVSAKEVLSLIQLLKDELPQLSTLSFCDCKVKRLPKETGEHLAKLGQLKSLKVPHNLLTELPSSMSLLNTSLTELDLCHNKFSNFPGEVLSKLNAMEVLDLSSNQLSTIESFTNTSIKSLKLRDNLFSSIPQTILTLQNLQSLNLSKNKLKALPENITQLQNLQHLYLKGNEITSVVQSIGNFTTLLTLDLSENQLKELPDQFGELTSLQKLEIQHNRFASVPMCICKLTRLLTLKMNDNNLTTLPPEMSTLTNLSELYLQENCLGTVPPEFGKLSSLRKLYLEFNKIKSLPDELSELKKLVVLILHHNRLMTLPNCIKNMKSLLRLSLDDNPLDEATRKIINDFGALELIEKDSASTVSRVRSAQTIHLKTLREGGGKRKKKKPNRMSATLRSNVSDGDLQPARGRSKTIASAPEYNLTENDKEESDELTSKSEPTPLARHRDSSATASNSPLPFPKFKAVFESVLEEQDFSKEKQETLKKLPVAEKWHLVKNYKASTLNLLKAENSKVKPLSPRKLPPSHFIQSLQGAKIGKKDLDSLKSYLLQNSEGWVATFIESGGINAILSLIERLSFKSELLDFEYHILEAAIACFKVLLDMALKTVVTTTNAVNIIALNYDSVNPQVRLAVLSILEDICHLPIIGQGLISEAFDYHHTHLQLKRDPKGQKFAPLMSILEKSIDEQDHDLTISCFSLINGLINNIELLEPRFEARNLFIRLGIHHLLKKLRKSKNQLLVLQLEIFEEYFHQDEDDMVRKYGRKEVLTMIQKEIGDVTSQGNVLLITSLAHNHADSAFHVVPNLNLPYTAETTVKSVLETVTNKAPQAEVLLNEHGLFLLQAENEGTWLDADKKLGDYDLKGEVFVEFKLKPWSFEVVSPVDKKASKVMELDPYLDCATIVNRILSGFNVDNDLEYNLCFFETKSSRPIKLEDTRALSSYAEKIRSHYQPYKSCIGLKLKPLPFTVMLTEGLTKTQYFNPLLKLSYIKKKVVTKLGLKRDLSEYGLEIVRDGQRIWLDEDLTLEAAELEQTPVKLVLKPALFKIELPTGSTEELLLDFDTSVGELLTRLLSSPKVKELDVEASKLALFCQHKNKEVELNTHQSLSQQHVPVDHILRLKSKSSAEITPADAVDMNIWEDNSTVDYENEDKTEIAFASLNRLVQLVTSPQGFQYLHLDFEKVFLMTYKHFTTPETMFEKIIQRFNVPAAVERTQAEAIKLRVCMFMKNWLEYEPLSSELAQKVLDFINTTVKTDFANLVPVLMKALTTPAKQSGMARSTEHPPAPKLPKSVGMDLTLFHIDPTELARQLTLILWDVYSKIKHTEFFNQAWGKMKQQSPNLTQLVNYFNDIATWVSTTVLAEKRVRDRAAVMDHLLKTAAALKDLNNFHALTAILSAFNSSPLLRLKWTREKISKRSKEILHELEAMMSVQGAFKVYRETLKNCKPPAIPYMGVYLTDLTFIEEGNPNYVGNRINFAKQLYIFRVISVIQAYQKFPYNLTPVESIQQFWQSAAKKPEHELYKLSLEREPRGATRNDID